MHHSPNSRKLRQFKHLAKKLNRLIENGGLENLAEESRNRLVDRFNRLYDQVRHLIPRFRLRTVLASAAVLLGLGATQTVEAQSFTAPLVNPFGITSGTIYAFPATADMDNDGDLDLFTGDFNNPMIYQENTGTASAPAFGTAVTSPFGITTGVLSAPALADMDNDGDNDLFIGSQYGVLNYYQNTGTAAVPTFAAPVVNPFGLDSMYYWSWPALADMDGDGDFDLLSGEYGGTFQYFQNTGTASAPAFAAPVQNAFGLSSVYTLSFPSIGDLDGDGDLDVMAGEYTADFQYFQNTGTNLAPAFAAPVVNPFGLVQGTAYVWAPNLVDLDNDGDLDILAGEYYGAINYFEDTAAVSNMAPTITAPANDTICRDSSTAMLAFTADDQNMDPLTVWGESNNQVVVPNGNIVIAGTQPNYTAQVTATSNVGSATISLYATDGTDTTSADFEVEVELCGVGLEEDMFANSFAVYPNPADNQLNYDLELLNSAEGIQITMLDLMGREVLNEKDPNPSLMYNGQLDVSGLSSGLYTLKISTGTFRLSRKVWLE